MNYSEILHINKYYILYIKMPVDKFGHTDVGYSQRVIAGRVTLSQVNATFLRLDGTNAMTGDLIFNNNKLVKALPTSYCIVLYSSIYIAPLNSQRQTEALVVRLAPRKEASFKK